MYREYNPRAKVSIEEGTDKVPPDRKYYVLRDDKIMKGFRSLKAAKPLYKQIIEELNLPPLPRDEGNPKPSPQSIYLDYISQQSTRSLLGIEKEIKGRKSGKFHKPK